MPRWCLVYRLRVPLRWLRGGLRVLGLLGPSTVVIDSAILGRIDEELDDLLLPYEFDLSLFSRISHADLLEHIRRAGVSFYEKPPAHARP